MISRKTVEPHYLFVDFTAVFKGGAFCRPKNVTNVLIYDLIMFDCWYGIGSICLNNRDVRSVYPLNWYFELAPTCGTYSFKQYSQTRLRTTNYLLTSILFSKSIKFAMQNTRSQIVPRLSARKLVLIFNNHKNEKNNTNVYINKYTQIIR